MTHRIMLMANAPWATTGYGVQIKHLAPRLQAMGHEMAVFAFYGLSGGVLNWNGVTIYPMGIDPWGADILESHMANFKADMLITLMDVWVTDWFGKKAQAGNFRWFPWLPIDQAPAPRAVVERLEGCEMALPYARFGERMLHEAGVQNTWYIPHGVDTRTFKPGDQAEARRKLKLPEDAYIIGMVAANKGYPSRKAIPEQLAAFAQFRKRHPNALLYLHTLYTDGHGGIDITAACHSLGITDAVRWTDPYSYLMGWPEERMATLYQAMDVLTAAGMGEGFGIPIVEAQACGTSVVTTNATAMPELTFAGVCVDKVQQFWTPLEAWAVIPNIEAVADAYETVYEQQHSGQRAELAETAVAGASAYDWDTLAAKHWRPFLEAV